MTCHEVSRGDNCVDWVKFERVKMVKDNKRVKTQSDPNLFGPKRVGSKWVR